MHVILQFRGGEEGGDEKKGEGGEEILMCEEGGVWRKWREEKGRDEREREREGETVTVGLPHLWAYHLACRGKITVPVPQGPE